MTTKTLTGYMPDRDLAIAYRYLAKKGIDAPDFIGFIEHSEIATSDELGDDAVNALAEFFAPETIKQTEQRFLRLAQDHLDRVARSRDYYDCARLCGFTTSMNPVFKAEAQAGVAFRDAVWEYCIKLLEDVTNGLIAIPDEKTFIADMPDIKWADR
jgi:hypothetical protein